MRKNRTRLRETIVLPEIKRRQEMIAKTIEKSLNEKKGKTIATLRQSLSKTSTSIIKPDSTAAPLTSAVNEVCDDMALEESEDNEKKKAFSGSKGKGKGSSARKNPNKILTWFK